MVVDTEEVRLVHLSVCIEALNNLRLRFSSLKVEVGPSLFPQTIFDSGASVAFVQSANPSAHKSSQSLDATIPVSVAEFTLFVDQVADLSIVSRVPPLLLVSDRPRYTFHSSV